ncbi:GNAT family N-acetyltransferase [Microbacterium sp. NPDC090007]|uniref:GNAT family N-acetyltransferase n=1 Tax=Microbacterium sp. NPDC090007 TaxID=3364204 RepID=UPI003806942A
MDDLRLEPLAPSLDDYLELRRASGLTPKRPDQGAPALENSWAWRRIVDADGRSVAMGRVIGDGGWYFLVADIATLPSHQRRGLGRRVLEDLLAEIRAKAPEGAYVTLLADPPGQALYSSLGFTEPTTGSVTMHRLMD